MECVVLPRVFRCSVFPFDLLSAKFSPRVNGYKLWVIIKPVDIAQDLSKRFTFSLKIYSNGTRHLLEELYVLTFIQTMFTHFFFFFSNYFIKHTSLVLRNSRTHRPSPSSCLLPQIRPDPRTKLNMISSERCQLAEISCTWYQRSCWQTLSENLRNDWQAMIHSFIFFVLFSFFLQQAALNISSQGF